MNRLVWRVVLLAATVGGCSTLESVSDSLFGSGTSVGQEGHVSGFLGAVVADEPQAAQAARNVLSAGGNAADAAVAGGLMLTVTLPSRAGIGGGGACLAYKAGKERGAVSEAIMFTALAPMSAAGSDRPAAVPMMARGLFALHARYGSRPFETLISPAEQAARFGVRTSRALARDIAVVAGPLAGDPTAAAVFLRNDAGLAEGAQLTQAELGATLAQIRTAGVGDMYQGSLARKIVEVTPFAGGALTMEDLRGGVPKLAAPLNLKTRNSDTVAFLPPPADGGLAAAAAFQALRNPTDTQAASARALSVAAGWRAHGGDPTAAISAPDAPAPALPALPASTTLVTLDRGGNAVVCAVTMNNLFGTGRMAQQTGILLAASPAWSPPAMLSAALAYNTNLTAFRAAVGGSGQAGAPTATAFAMAQALAGSTANPAPEPGRANVIACARYLPGADGSCSWATDPRGAGLAVGSN